MDDPDLYRRAGALFDAVVDVDSARREAALEAADAADPEAAELARRLLAADAAPRALASPPRETERDPDDPAGVLGASVGAYRIEALLGEGGMGAVYLGTRTEPHARVAIKFITLSAAPAQVLERFRMETQWLASIEHPGVVRYRSSGVDPLGRAYLVMDYIDGRPPSSERMDVAGVVSLVRDVARAVHHLHQRGVLHRDIKPSNILLRERDGESLPVLIDLGISSAIGTESSHEGPAQIVPKAAGTPGFMSPESSVSGRGPDVRSDVYGLGALLFALLSGHQPHPAGHPIESIEVSSLGERIARQRQSQVDARLDAITSKALAVDPDERYGSAEAFAADLGRWQQDLPVEALPASSLARLRLLVRRRPVEIMLAGALLLTLVTAGAATLRGLARERATSKRYLEQLSINEDTLKFFQQEVFARAYPERDGPDAPIGDILRSAVQSISSEGGEAHPILLVSVATSLLRVFRQLDFVDDAVQLMERADIHARNLPETSFLRLNFDLERGAMLIALERLEEAEQVLLGTWDRLEIQGLDDPGRAHVGPQLRTRNAQSLSVLYEMRGNYERAERWISTGLELARHTSGDPSIQQRLLYSLGVVQLNRGKNQSATSIFERLLDDFLKSGSESPEVMGANLNLATLRSRLGQPERALPHARAAVDIANKTLPKFHQHRAIALSVLAATLNSVGDHCAAVEPARESLELSRERWGTESSETADQALNLVENMLMCGTGANAQPWAEEAERIYSSILADADPADCEPLARVWMYRARVALEGGESNAAAEFAARAMKLATGARDAEWVLELARTTAQEAALAR